MCRVSIFFGSSLKVRFGGEGWRCRERELRGVSPVTFADCGNMSFPARGEGGWIAIDDISNSYHIHLTRFEAVLLEVRFGGEGGGC